MMRLPFILVSIYSTLCLSEKCVINDGVHALLWTQLYQLGFHSNVRCNVEIMLTKWNPKNNCTVLILQNIPSGLYVDPDEVHNLNYRRNTMYFVPDRVDIELPANKAKPHKFVMFSDLKISDNLLMTEALYPIHSRYHSPKDGSKEALEVTVEIPPPKLFFRCGKEDRYRSCQTLEFLCGAYSSEQCTWVHLPYKATQKIAVVIPVGDSSQFITVSCITFVLVFFSTLYLSIVICNKDSINQLKLSKKD